MFTKQASVSFFICLTATLFAYNLFAQSALQSIHYSGLYNTNQMDILVQSPQMGSIIHDIDGTAVNSPLSPWNGLSTWQTGSISLGDNHNLGFHSESPELGTTPMRWDGIADPPLAYYSPLSTDAVGDHLFTSAWLDITETKICYTQDRLYFAIKNNHTSFPVSSGLTYYAYMPVIVDPAALPEDDPIVFGLMYTVNVPGIMSPGLYKITGTGFSDLSRIGDITSSVSGQTLVLSCAIADLLADEDFASWYNPASPLFTVSSTSSKITLTSGSLQADISPGAKVSLSPIIASTVNNFVPQLSEPLFAYEPGETATLTASIIYSDADGNFPHTATISIDDREELPLIPEGDFNGDFVGGVRFSSGTVYLNSSFSHVHFNFSDGDVFVHYSWEPSALDDETNIPKPAFKLSPNPARNAIYLKELPSEKEIFTVYDIKGRKVLSQSKASSLHELEINIADLPAGVYLLRSSLNETLTRRFIKLN